VSNWQTRRWGCGHAGVGLDGLRHAVEDLLAGFHAMAAARPSENEAATSGNVALLIYKTMTSSTRPTNATEAKIFVPQLVRWPSRWHVDIGMAYGTAFNPL